MEKPGGKEPWAILAACPPAWSKTERKWEQPKENKNQTNKAFSYQAWIPQSGSTPALISLLFILFSFLYDFTHAHCVAGPHSMCHFSTTMSHVPSTTSVTSATFPRSHPSSFFFLLLLPGFSLASVRCSRLWDFSNMLYWWSWPYWFTDLPFNNTLCVHLS